MRTRLIHLSLFLAFLTLQVHSSPLDTWYWRNPLTTGAGLEDVAYGNGRYVIVGSGEILTSTDAIEWIPNATRRQDALLTVAFGDGKFVAAGYTSTGIGPDMVILTSQDGVQWDSRSIPVPDCGGINRLAYGNGRFVGVGSKYCLVSSNAVDWTWGDLGEVFRFLEVIFANGKFFTVGYYFTPVGGSLVGVILTSTDGVNWTRAYSIEHESIPGIAYGGGTFVATSGKGKAITSPDGVTWTVRPTVSGYELGFVAYASGRFVASAMPGAYLTSTNGFDWNAVTTPLGGRVTSENDLFFVVTSNSDLKTSVDGMNWISRKSGFDDYLKRVIFANGTFVALGDREAVLTSADGATWTKRNAEGTNTLTGVAFGNGLFAAVGWNGRVQTSPDLVNWQRQTLDTNEWLYSIAYGNQMFLTAGDRGGVYASTDGSNWTRIESDPDRSFATLDYAGNLFIGVSHRGSIYTSLNGASWALRHSVGGFTPDASVAYGDGIYVVSVGDVYGNNKPVICTSSNGVDWSSVPPADPTFIPHAVSYGSGLFFAVGTGAISTSPDAKTWTRRYRPWLGPSVASVAYGSGTFVAVGLNRIVQSAPLVSLGQRPDGYLSIKGAPGRSYLIEATSNLNTSDAWQALETVSLTNSSTLWRDNSPALPERRFYRAALVP